MENLTPKDKAEIRRLRALRRPDGKHEWTLQRLGRKYKVSHQRISQIVDPASMQQSNARYRGSDKGKAKQATHNAKRRDNGYYMVYMRHYRRHTKKGVTDPDCFFCKSKKAAGGLAAAALIVAGFLILSGAAAATR